MRRCQGGVAKEAPQRRRRTSGAAKAALPCRVRRPALSQHGPARRPDRLGPGLPRTAAACGMRPGGGDGGQRPRPRSCGASG